MQRVRILLILFSLGMIVLFSVAVFANQNGNALIYLPAVGVPAAVEITTCTIEDGDGNQSTTDDRTALSGWTVYLSINGVQQTPGQLTGEDGCYTWGDLTPGLHYGVEEILPSGWSVFGSTSRDFGLATPGASYSHDFINYEIPVVVVEFRGLWVTRFDWTTYLQPADPAKIDEIVQDAASAGFNAIFFQVRGTADAFYQPGPEPWAQRVSGGALGQPPDPFWDPLAYMIQRAHEQGIELHAYLNVYPVWDNCNNPPPHPDHFYYALEQEHGTTDGRLNGLQWTTSNQTSCGTYLRATPASAFADEHYLEVAQYLVDNYDIDGLHLDHIRYAGGNTSCDPVSAVASGVNCFTSAPPGHPSYASWQRAQVNGTVSKFYNQIILNNANLWLSAAVWPLYRDYWGWGYNSGYDYYYQDSKAWVLDGYIDSISPMLYGSTYGVLSRWQQLVADFQADSGGRFIIPGIGADFDSFGEIEARINSARDIGTAGHAIFSYGALNSHQYFDDLAAGPYAEPAVVPEITWHP